MKALRVLFVLLMVAGLLFMSSCDDDYPRLLENSFPPSERVMIEANTVSYEASLILNGDIRSETFRKSSVCSNGSCDAPGLETMCCRQQHITYLDEHDNILIRDGYFELSGNGADYLSGTYDGIALEKDHELYSELTMTVEQGSGLYQGAKGNLTMTMEPGDEDGEYISRISGVVYIPNK